MFDVNNLALTTPYYRRLSDDQLHALHDATLEILERTGVRFDSQEAVALFREGGCRISEGNRVRIPRWLVEWALRVAPKRLILYDQEGQPAIRLSGRLGARARTCKLSERLGTDIEN